MESSFDIAAVPQEPSIESVVEYVSDEVLAPELTAEKPVVFEVMADEIGVMYAASASAYVFNQFLLERLKRFAPHAVEGVIRFKLTHGHLARVRPSVKDQSGSFKYMWLPDGFYEAMTEAARAQGFLGVEA